MATEPPLKAETRAPRKLTDDEVEAEMTRLKENYIRNMEKTRRGESLFPDTTQRGRRQ